jgi:hypothetical protein
MTNDASAASLGYANIGSTTENEVVERNPMTIRPRTPISMF